MGFKLGFKLVAHCSKNIKLSYQAHWHEISHSSKSFNYLIDYRIINADTVDELAEENMYQRIYFDRFCFKLKILKNAQGGGDDY